jgi:hypothetical protein
MNYKSFLNESMTVEERIKLINDEYDIATADLKQFIKEKGSSLSNKDKKELEDSISKLENLRKTSIDVFLKAIEGTDEK